MNLKVKEVKPLEGYKLFLVFTNNEIGIFDEVYEKSIIFGKEVVA